MKYDTLPPEEHSFGADGSRGLFRVIAPDDCLFYYRIPDYEGGFYLFLQTVAASGKEMKKQIAFDKLKPSPVNHVLRYCPAGFDDMGHGFSIPKYDTYSITLPEGVGFEQFDPKDKNNRWELYEGLFGNSSLPDPMVVMANLNIYSYRKREAMNFLKAFQEEVMAEQTAFMDAGRTMRCDLSVIRQLKSKKQYDTIIHTGKLNIYYNIDMVSYEQSTAPDEFYITYKKYYPGGELREMRKFLPNVYGPSLPVGISGYYNKSGEMEDVSMAGYEIFPFPDMANVAFCVRLLEREGFIDLRTGNGKATMQINRHVDPYDPGHEPRLSISATWGIQADDTPDSTIALLVAHDGIETVYIIDKNSRTILRKNNRY